MTKNRILPALGAIAALAVGTWLLYEPHDHSQHSGHGAGHQPPTIAERMSFFGPGQVNPDFRYVARTATYSTNVIGDGTTANGGTPPAAFEEPPDIPSNFAVAKWMQDAVENGDCYYDTAFPATRPPGCPIRDGLEAKFRTHCNYSHSAAVDPVLYPNQVNRSHLHSFFGNRAVDQFTTYESLRTKGGSTCGGGPINRTGYWYPAVLKDNALGDGKTMIVRLDYVTVYYTDAPSRVPKLTRIPRGLQYIAGFKMHDPTDAAVKAELPGGYTYYTNGWNGWKCASGNGAYIGGVMANGAYPNAAVPGSGLQPYLRNANGTATLDCPTGSQIIASLSGPNCWDGHNLSSPNGRDHMRYVVNKSDGQKYCPDGWYWLPTLELSFFFSNDGPSDYKEWYLSSDRFEGASFLNGESFHTDWFGGWDYTIMKTWMKRCNGIAGIDGSSGTDNWRECSDSQFGDGTQGAVQMVPTDGSTGGVSQINLAPRNTPELRYESLPQDR